MSDKKNENEDNDLIGSDELISPASQIGRLRQTGGTPESRRQIDPDVGDDGEHWIEPTAEDETIPADA
jgi:hypothetical protein